MHPRRPIPVGGRHAPPPFPALLLILAFLPATPGCTTQAKAKRDAERAFQEGQRQVLAAQQQAQASPQPMVWFRGLVRQTRIPWSEGLTLSQALAAAHYTGALDPSVILVLRQGQVHHIDPKRLLRGEEDPELLPGDLIDPRP